MIREFTRKDLYDLVWSEPMSRLAKRFVVSDVTLAKACRRGEIPVPGLGYWAKVQYGKEVERTPLPPDRPGLSGTVSITRLPARSSQPPPPPDVQEQVDYETMPAHRIVVPNTLSKVHPIVRDWIKRTSGGISNTERRRLRILSTLFNEVEKRGYALVPNPNNQWNMAVKMGAETVEFWLKERRKRSRVTITTEEKHYSFGRDWRHVLEPSGKLVFTIQSWLNSEVRKEWSDGTRKPLEEQLNDIIVGLVLAAACLHRQRLKREAEERRRRTAERERWELQEPKRRKERQLQTLMEDVNAWQQAARIRQYVQAVKAAVETWQRTIDPTRLELWASRALALANELDPLTSAELVAVDGTHTEAQTT